MHFRLEQQPSSDCGALVTAPPSTLTGTVRLNRPKRAIPASLPATCSMCSERVAAYRMLLRPCRSETQLPRWCLIDREGLAINDRRPSWGNESAPHPRGEPTRALGSCKPRDERCRGHFYSPLLQSGAHSTSAINRCRSTITR